MSLTTLVSANTLEQGIMRGICILFMAFLLCNRGKSFKYACFDMFELDFWATTQLIPFLVLKSFSANRTDHCDSRLWIQSIELGALVSAFSLLQI